MTTDRLPTPCYLAQLTWQEAQALAAQRPVILLPVGATEAHGPHLPLGTDVYLSEELARRVHAALLARGRNSAIAPSLSYAVTDFAGGFAGTVSLDAATATAQLVGVLTGLARSGFTRVCLVNSHLEAAHIASLHAACAQAAARTGHKVAFPDHTARRWARTLTDEYKRGDCHAGRYETALLLAAQPALVREPIRAGLPANDSGFLTAVHKGAVNFVEAGGPQAYFGDPAQATADEGEAIYALLQTMVLTVIEETWEGEVGQGS
jgi:creatinine amidohydrolase